MAKEYKPDYIHRALHRFASGEVQDDGELRLFCPSCEEPGVSKSPSASVNVEKGVWACQGKCGQSGGVSALFQIMRDNGLNVRSEYMKGTSALGANPMKKTPPSKKPISKAIALRAHDTLMNNSKAALARIKRERGLTDETLRKFQIGWDGMRYTIPIYDSNGDLRNIRKYKLKATGSEHKMLNTTGYGEARLFGVDILEQEDVVVFCEGEMDMLVLNQFGIPAVTSTSGAGKWTDSWSEAFRGKTVYICQDNDDAGKAAAKLISQRLHSFAEMTYIVEIPLDHKGADVTDYLVLQGHTAEEFEGLMKAARPSKAESVVHSPLSPPPTSSEVKEVSLRGSRETEGSLSIRGMIAGRLEEPAYFPLQVTGECQQNAGKACDGCPFLDRDGRLTRQFGVNDPDLFRFIGSNEDRTRKLYKELLGSQCPPGNVQWSEDEVVPVERLIISDFIDGGPEPEEANAGNTERPIYSIGTTASEPNTNAIFTGMNVVSPKDRTQYFMAWENRPIKISLDEVGIDDIKWVASFKASHMETEGEMPDPLEQCFKIARELSEKVTRIYERDLLHVAYDLVFHSPLAYHAGSEYVDRGWLELFVIGDTRTGKSETAKQLINFYQQGVIKAAESATFVGLVGGSKETDGSWQITWGTIPLHDRRLVVIDEVSDAKDPNLIAKMSSVRSSGRGEVTSVAGQWTTHARTRLIWISNPADGSMLSEWPSQGIDALRTVIKANEDIARLDLAIGVLQSPDAAAEINKSRPPVKPLTDEEVMRYRKNVLLAWALKPHQIRVSSRAVERALALSRDIGKEYTADPPLLQAENARLKILRVAVAIAARTGNYLFNADVDKDHPDAYHLHVWEEHVDAAWRFLNMLYDDKAFPYHYNSKRAIARTEKAKRRRKACMDWLRQNEGITKALIAIGGQDFRPNDLPMYAGKKGLEFEADHIIGQLADWQMITRKHTRGREGAAKPTAELIAILRELEYEMEEV